MIPTFYPSEKHFEDACSEYLIDVVNDPIMEKLKGVQPKFFTEIKDHQLLKMYALRQVYLGDFGKLDLATISLFKNQKGDNIFTVNIFELKNVLITIADVEQVHRYRYAFIQHNFKYVYCNLIGPSVSVEPYTLHALSWNTTFYTYRINFSGGHFIMVEPHLKKNSFDIDKNLNSSTIAFKDYTEKEETIEQDGALTETDQQE